MKLAVISDTHFTKTPAWLDRVFTTWLEPADFLFHCGDIISFDTWAYFLQHENFHAVRGNCDWDQKLVDMIKPMETLEVGGLTVGLTHGWGPRPQVADRVAEAFGSDYDLICYGHTHKRDWSMKNGVQLCNPGSLGELGSLAIIEVHDDKSMDCEFIDADF